MVQVRWLICVSMVVSLGFVNCTGVMVIVSHNPDTPRCPQQTLLEALGNPLPWGCVCKDEPF